MSRINDKKSVPTKDSPGRRGDVEKTDKGAPGSPWPVKQQEVKPRPPKK
jgi:hypothetical protein